MIVCKYKVTPVSIRNASKPKNISYSSYWKQTHTCTQCTCINMYTVYMYQHVHSVHVSTCTQCTCVNMYTVYSIIGKLGVLYTVYTTCINRASTVVKSLLREFLNHTRTVTKTRYCPIIVASGHGSDSVYTCN